MKYGAGGGGAKYLTDPGPDCTLCGKVALDNDGGGSVPA